MATATVQIDIGFTLPNPPVTADFYPEISDTVSYSGVALTEATNRKGVYIGTVSGPTPGCYKIVIKCNGVVLPTVFYVNLVNAAAACVAADQPVIFNDLPTLTQFITIDTGKTSDDVVAGSIAGLSQGDASSLTPTDIAAAVLAAMVDSGVSLAEANKRVLALLAGNAQGPRQLAPSSFTVNDAEGNPYLTISINLAGQRTVAAV